MGYGIIRANLNWTSADIKANSEWKERKHEGNGIVGLQTPMEIGKWRVP